MSAAMKEVRNHGNTRKRKKPKWITFGERVRF